MSVRKQNVVQAVESMLESVRVLESKNVVQAVESISVISVIVYSRNTSKSLSTKAHLLFGMC